MKITVLGGGNSTEREVSLRSALAVTDALRSKGYEVINLDPVDFKILDTIEPDTIVFPILHGNNGEDGKIQSALEERKLAYLGTESIQSAVCFDKTKTREAFDHAGLPIATGDTVTRESYGNHPMKQQSHVLKINQGGSSIGTYVVFDPGDINEAKVEAVFALGSHAVIEELITGIEITVPILDGKALPVIEIRPPENAEFDYENKYNGKTQELCPAVSIGQDVQKKAQAYAERAHAAMGCRHLSRVDIIVRPDNSMVLLEINTMPGMTNQSLYPLGAKVAGYEFPELMQNFIELVKRDYGM